MSQRYVIAIQASRDIESVADYLARNSGFDIADRFTRDLTEKFRKLTRFPNIGRRRDELSSGLRSLPFETYLIFYRSTSEEIEIARVVSGYQDLEALFAEPDS